MSPTQAGHSYKGVGTNLPGLMHRKTRPAKYRSHAGEGKPEILRAGAFRAAESSTRLGFDVLRRNAGGVYATNVVQGY